MAQGMKGEHREQLLNMAKVWEQLANDREERLLKDPEAPESDNDTDTTS